MPHIRVSKSQRQHIRQRPSLRGVSCRLYTDQTAARTSDHALRPDRVAENEGQVGPIDPHRTTLRIAIARTAVVADRAHGTSPCRTLTAIPTHQKTAI